MTALFITLEGIEGAGKSTLAARLARWFEERGLPCLVTREPGGTETGERLRDILLHAPLPLSHEAELLLIQTARAQLMHELILPALERGENVILDRHTDSSLAYQGYGRGLDLAAIRMMNAFACQGRAPDLTVLLDLSVEEGMRRARLDRVKAAAPDRFEGEAWDFMGRAREGFLRIAEDNPERVQVVSAQLSFEQVWESVIETVGKRLNDACTAGETNT